MNCLNSYSGNCGFSCLQICSFPQISLSRCVTEQSLHHFPGQIDSPRQNSAECCLMLGAVKVVPNDGITALVDIPDCCGKSEGWQFCMQIRSSRGEVDDSAPDGRSYSDLDTLYILPIGSSNTQWGTLSDRLLMETVTWTPSSLPHTQQPNTRADTITHWLVPDSLFTQIHNYSRSGQIRGLSFHFLSLPSSITEKCPPFALCLTSVFHSWPLLHYGN